MLYNKVVDRYYDSFLRAASATYWKMVNDPEKALGWKPERMTDKQNRFFYIGVPYIRAFWLLGFVFTYPVTVIGELEDFYRRKTPNITELNIPATAEREIMERQAREDMEARERRKGRKKRPGKWWQ